MEIKDSGDRRTFESGAVRDMGENKGRMDLMPMCVLLRLSKHYEKGLQKYGERNWEKGIPAHSFADSALRHLVKYLDGWDDEPHLDACLWNICGLMWTEEKRPDLMDIPARQKANKATGTCVGCVYADRLSHRCINENSHKYTCIISPDDTCDRCKYDEDR